MKKEKILKPLYLSDGFINILNEILKKSNGKSNISKRLLEYSDNDNYMYDFTYLDRSEKDDIVSFVQTQRVDRYLEQNGGDLTDIWNMKGRVETRIGRIIRRIFGTRFNESSIENFVNKYKSVIRVEKEFDNFELVSGEDITFWYHSNKYESHRGVLGGSCMQGSEKQKYLKIYENNPNQIKLCILKNSEGTKIKGRAIVWKVTEPDIYFMDRIYTNDDADVNLFKEYAKRNNWNVKLRQTYSDNVDIVTPDGSHKVVKMYVHLDNVEFTRYPYMDTMKFFCKDEKNIYNSYQSGCRIKSLNDTDGYYDEYYDGDREPEYVTDYLGHQILQENSVYCEYDNVYCLRSNSIRVRKGEHGRGKHFIPNSPFLKFSEHTNEYYHKDDTVYSEFLKSWIYKRYSVKMYLDKDKSKYEITHRDTKPSLMGRINSDYFINEILFLDDNEVYHFIDEMPSDLEVLDIDIPDDE
jgi:hypothetical protein